MEAQGRVDDVIVIDSSDDESDAAAACQPRDCVLGKYHHDQLFKDCVAAVQSVADFPVSRGDISDLCSNTRYESALKKENGNLDIQTSSLPVTHGRCRLFLESRNNFSSHPKNSDSEDLPDLKPVSRESFETLCGNNSKNSENTRYSDNRENTTEMAHLCRNTVFGPYSSAFLPVSSIKHCSHPFQLYHKQFIETVLDSDVDIAVSYLKDFTAHYMPDVDIVEQCASVLTKKELDLVTQSQLFCVILAIYQRHPEVIFVPDSLLETLLSSQHCTSSLIMASLYTKALELDLYTRNFCDNVKILHSLAYSLLSWEKGRRNILRVVQMIRNIFTENISDHKMTLLHLLQHLITLGLETSIRDKLQVMRSIAAELKRVYMDIEDTQQRRAFVQSVERPLLTVMVTRMVLEEKYEVERCDNDIIAESVPSVKMLVELYFCAIPKQSSLQDSNMESLCEELVFLLEILIHNSLECVAYRVHETTRSRLLRPGTGKADITDLQFKVQHLSHHLHRLCPLLTSTTKQHLLQLEYILDCGLHV